MEEQNNIPKKSKTLQYIVTGLLVPSSIYLILDKDMQTLRVAAVINIAVLLILSYGLASTEKY